MQWKQRLVPEDRKYTRKIATTREVETSIFTGKIQWKQLLCPKIATTREVETSILLVKSNENRDLWSKISTCAGWQPHEVETSIFTGKIQWKQKLVTADHCMLERQGGALTCTCDRAVYVWSGFTCADDRGHARGGCLRVHVTWICVRRWSSYVPKTVSACTCDLDLRARMTPGPNWSMAFYLEILAQNCSCEMSMCISSVQARAKCGLRFGVFRLHLSIEEPGSKGTCFWARENYQFPILTK